MVSFSFLFPAPAARQNIQNPEIFEIWILFFTKIKKLKRLFLRMFYVQNRTCRDCAALSRRRGAVESIASKVVGGLGVTPVTLDAAGESHGP